MPHDPLERKSHHPSTPDSSFTQGAADEQPPRPASTEDIEGYRKLRARRRQARRRAQDWRSAGTEDDAVIELACIWAPYGGAPADEIFIRFGINTGRFIELLWQILNSRHCGPSFTEHLAVVYPPGKEQMKAPHERDPDRGGRPGAVVVPCALHVHRHRRPTG